ncbi:MAG TPA: prolyl oligopeptidase family serine peptidase [Candidatus Dormibacteraeota bacterium]|nr:prolyl oligopeptidase family serine peptidase [Candidatus Dormibacteraeota bacterium]
MPPAVVAPPPTPVEPVTESLHGVEITDPYRWLEDQNSPQTRAWLEEQTAYTRTYLGAIPGREQIRERVRELMAFKEVISEPWNVGDRYFFLKRHEDKEQPVIVMRDGLFGEETVLVDPASRATGTSTAISIVAISQDARFLAYSVRQGGTDHSALEILDIERNTVLPDRLPEGFCTAFVFVPDGTGFYYSHRAVRDPRPNYKAAFWHGFGSDRSQDVEVFFAGEEPNLFLGILDSPEAKVLAYVVFSSGKRPTTSLYLHSLEPGAAPRLLLGDIEGCFAPFFAHRQLFAYTDFTAPNFRIVGIALDAPDPTHWRDIVPQSDRRIQQFTVAGDRIFVTRVDNFSTQIQAFRIKDGEKKEFPFSPHGTIDLLNPTNRMDSLFYSYTSIAQPTAAYCYSTLEERSCLWQEPNVPFDSSLIAVEETRYPSKDGTSIPLFLAARKDLLHSGPLPTFLTGYGGFGSCVTPRFTAFATFLIEQGLLLAVPALRGGSELGEKWHKEGKRENRQNSFDDVIAAAEWLMSEGRSARGRIAIGGGSNAGLLVGAAITQRPDLFRAAICLGPLLDMTRYHLFDFAAGWAEEYGSPEDERDLHSLLAYSPYHRVQDGADYPAVLLISGDADTRCNPMHARKMAARLQAANRSEWPILLDYKPDWGHMPVQPLSAKIEAVTDRLAFICHELRIQVQHRRSF